MGKKQKNTRQKKRLCAIVICAALCLFLIQITSPATAAPARSIEGVAKAIVKQLARDFKKSPGFSQTGPKPLVFVSKTYFADPHTGNTYPFSSFLALEMKNALTETNLFTVTDDPSSICPMILTGDYYKAKGNLVVSCSLVGLSTTDVDAGEVAATLASGRKKLDKKHLEPAWFKESVDNKMSFLMRRLENKFANKLAFGQKASVQVHKFSYQKSSLYSPFSDYLGQHVTSFLTQSGRLVPKMDMDTLLADTHAIKTRGVLPKAKTKEATMAELSGASYYITGAYWQPSPAEIEVQASLATSQGNILASQSVRIPANLVSPQLLELPQKNDAAFMSDYNSFAQSQQDQGPFSVEIFTPKGRNNLTYKLGEIIVFYIKTNRPAYVRIFNRNADGGIYQIFPNAFDKGQRPIDANRIVPVPDTDLNAAFEFEISEPTGNELVKVFASEKPLPELDSEDTGYFGVRKMNITAAQIQKQYEKHALNHGIFLAQDIITLRTSK